MCCIAQLMVVKQAGFFYLQAYVATFVETGFIQNTSLKHLVVKHRTHHDLVGLPYLEPTNVEKS